MDSGSSAIYPHQSVLFTHPGARDFVHRDRLITFSAPISIIQECRSPTSGPRLPIIICTFPREALWFFLLLFLPPSASWIPQTCAEVTFSLCSWLWCFTSHTWTSSELCFVCFWVLCVGWYERKRFEILIECRKFLSLSWMIYFRANTWDKAGFKGLSMYHHIH